MKSSQNLVKSSSVQNCPDIFCAWINQRNLNGFEVSVKFTSNHNHIILISNYFIKYYIFKLRQPPMEDHLKKAKLEYQLSSVTSFNFNQHGYFPTLINTVRNIVRGTTYKSIQFMFRQCASSILDSFKVARCPIPPCGDFYIK